jgi:DNA-binding transcriptional ArsR family regulator
MEVSQDSSLGRTLSALADPTRRAVVGLLLGEARRAGDLALALDVTPPALSRHLRVLRKSGLIAVDDDDDDARVRVYRLRAEGFAPLRDWVSEISEYWHDQLQAFKVHAEKAARGTVNRMGPIGATSPAKPRRRKR